MKEMKNAGEELEKALNSFRDFLLTKEFTLSKDATVNLRRYMMDRKERILFQLRRKERTPEDLAKGFRKLAEVASEIALSEGRRNVTYQDIDKARKRIFCKIWPFCE